MVIVAGVQNSDHNNDDYDHYLVCIWCYLHRDLSKKGVLGARMCKSNLLTIFFNDVNKPFYKAQRMVLVASVQIAEHNDDDDYHHHCIWCYLHRDLSKEGVLGARMCKSKMLTASLHDLN